MRCCGSVCQCSAVLCGAVVVFVSAVLICAGSWGSRCFVLCGAVLCCGSVCQCCAVLCGAVVVFVSAALCCAVLW